MVQAPYLPDSPHAPPATDVNAVLADATAFMSVLDDWARAGWIRWLDAEFTRFLYQQQADAPVLLLLAAALTSHQNGHGHVCLDIERCLAEPDKALSLPPELSLHQPSLTPRQVLAPVSRDQWLQALTHPVLVSTYDNQDDATGGGPEKEAYSGNQPLVLDQRSGSPLLYLRRFWHYEQTLARTIQQRLSSPPRIDEKQLAMALDTVFTQLSVQRQDTLTEQCTQCDWQKIACALAVRNRFAIITGGPGTGKTTTVVKLLAVLQAIHDQSGHGPLRIRLAAPTGKAAARLGASITSQLAQHDLQGVPGNVSTVHRLLGPRPNSRFFKHHAGHPLPVDVVVIDEASMVDVELMALLLDALPAQARLVLLGDKDQLASVEAGAVLGSLCQRAAQAHYTQQTVDWLESVTGEHVPADLIDNNGTRLDQAITMLRYSHRFGAIPGIGKLAQAVNRSASADTLEQFWHGQFSELTRIRISSTQDHAFARLISDTVHGYGRYLLEAKQHPDADADEVQWDDWALAVLKAHGRFQLLAALRKGEFGVEGLNKRIEAALHSAGLIASWRGEAQANSAATTNNTSLWYPGRPVMVTRNDYNLDLMNGDIGVTLPYPHAQDDRGNLILRVAFPTADKARPVRWLLPSRLQSVETVFAMTVHKSQGSEFSHTALLLPRHDNPVLTRELIYTGITRASKRFTLVDADPRVLAQAAASSVFRASGLLPTINALS